LRGINHQTWYLKVQYKGADWTGRLLEGFERHPTYQRREKVRIDIMRRFGYFSTESNGHLSEYVAWYRKRPAEIKKWIDLGTWIDGETGGYLRVCTQGRNWFQTDFPKWMKQTSPKFGPHDRSIEHGSYIIESIVTAGSIAAISTSSIATPSPTCRRIAWSRCRVLSTVWVCISRRWASCPRLCRCVQRVGQCPAPGGAGGGARRRDAFETGDDDGSAGRGGVHPARDFADDGRNARRPGAMAAAIPPGHTGRQKTICRRTPSWQTRYEGRRAPAAQVAETNAEFDRDRQGRASVLLPVALPVKKLNLPDAGIKLATPVEYLASAFLCDIRAIHGGADGLVYIQSDVRIPRAGAGSCSMAPMAR